MNINRNASSAAIKTDHDHFERASGNECGWTDWTDVSAGDVLPDCSETTFRESAEPVSSNDEQTTGYLSWDALEPAGNRPPFGLSQSVAGSDVDRDREGNDEPQLPPADVRTCAARYELLRLIGQGAWGRVWLARDLRLNREVALKEICPQSAGSEVARQRLVKEAQVTGQLEHPNIVPIHELGHDTATRLPFYAMRYLGNDTLKNAIARHHQHGPDEPRDPLELHRLLTCFVGVCQAVGYAHSQGVVHRDLKPANVALGEFGEVVVLDWGLAKTIDEADTDVEPDSDSWTLRLSADAKPADTTLGDVMGTPAFMSPEQAAGLSRKVGYHSDIYGLGAMLFAILTGRAPHERAYPNEPMQDLLDRIVVEPTPRASERVPVPPALDAICAKAMSHRPSGRYGAARELADDVSRWMAGEVVSVYRDSWSKRVSRCLARHRVWAQAGMTAFVLSVLVVSTMLAERLEYGPAPPDFHPAASAVLVLEASPAAPVEHRWFSQAALLVALLLILVAGSTWFFSRILADSRDSHGGS